MERDEHEVDVPEVCRPAQKRWRIVSNDRQTIVGRLRRPDACREQPFALGRRQNAAGGIDGNHVVPGGFERVNNPRAARYRDVAFLTRSAEQDCDAHVNNYRNGELKN
jgi:hypothetical protein